MKNFFAKQRRVLEKKHNRRITQREIADKLGYRDSLVGFWETEVSAPDIARSADLARIYEVEESVIHSEIAELAARVAKARQQAKREPAAAD